MQMKKRSKSASQTREKDDKSVTDVLLDQLRQHLNTMQVGDNPLEALKEIRNWAVTKEAYLGENPQPLVTSTAGLHMAPVDFMILTHRAIKAGMSKALELLAHTRTVVEGVKLFEQTSRLIDLHTKHEDDVFFPYLKKNVKAITTHDDSHLEAVNKRQLLVQKLKSFGVDETTLKQLHTMVHQYEEHMRGEEEEMIPAVNELMKCSSDSVHQTGRQLIKYDLKELLAHAVPFTTIQLCRTANYEDGIKLYAKTLQSATTEEAYVGISKVMLMSAFEANKKYAAQLVDENVLSAAEPINVLSEHIVSPAVNTNPIPKTRKAVAAWLEKNHKGHWSWKDVNMQREVQDVDALMRAERLHLKLAERFAEPLNLKHVMIEEGEDGADQTIYFFIDNTWEMARRALFAKLYTRMHKVFEGEKKKKKKKKKQERGRRMHVVIIDAKERRTLAKRDLNVRPTLGCAEQKMLENDDSSSE